MIFKTTRNKKGDVQLKSNIGNIRDLFTRQNVFSDSDINAIKAYNNEFIRLSENAKQSSANVSNHTIAQKAANNTMKNASKAAQNVVANAKNGTVALNTLTTSSKAATISMKALATAGNMLLFLGITKGIELAVKGIDKLIETKKEAEEALENAKSVSDSYRTSINDVISSQNELASNIRDIKERYAELSQGVDSMSNKNFSLSTDDYNEFLDLNSQLANLFPTLTRGYDENGNAILGLGNNIDTVTGKIQALVEQQERLANREILDNLENYVNGDDDGGGQLEEIKRLKKEKEDDEKLVRVHDDVRKLFDTDDISSVNKIAGISSGVIDPLMRKAGFGTNLAQLDTAGFWQFNLDESEMKHLKETFATYYEELKAKAQTTKDELTNANAEMSSEMMYWVQYLPQYTNAKDENMQTAMMNMVNGIDWTSAGASDYDSAKSVIQQLVLSPLNNMSNDPTTQKKFSTAISGLFSLDTADIPANEAQEIIQNYIGKIMHILNKFKNEEDKLSLDDTYSMFGFSNLLENKANFSGSLSKIAGGNTPDMQKISDYTKEFTLSQQQAWVTATSGAQDAESAIEQYENSIISSETDPPSFQDAWNGLDPSVKDSLLDLAKTGQLTAETLQETDGADTFLAQIGIGAEDATEKIKNLLSTQEKLAAFSQGLSGLSSAFEEFQENKFVSAETLNSLPDAFKNLKGYDIFSQIVGDPESGTQKIQNAFDQIVTEYLESQNILDGATSQNKNVIIANLQQAGIGNAEELVNSYVNSMEENKPLIQGASDEILQYLSNNNETDVNNFIAALQSKNANYTELASTLGEDNATLLAKFGSQYGDDLANWITLLQQKEDAYNQYVQEYNDSLEEQHDGFDELNMPVERAVANKSADTATLTQNANKVSTAKQNMDNAKKDLDETEQDTNKKIAKKLAKMLGKFKVSGYQPKSPSESNENENTTPKETKQSFDWLERKVSVLTSKLNLLKAKIENVFSVRKKNSFINDEIKNTNSLIKAYKQQEKTYKAQADKSAKSEKTATGNDKTKLTGKKGKKIIKQIQSGQIKGSKKQWIQEYGESTANAIEEYQNYWDKFQEARINIQSARTSKRELKILKHQNKVDKYDARSNKYDAKIENATTAEEKKDLENQKIKSTKKSYNQQIKIAKLEYGKNSPQVAKLKAEKKTAVRDIKIENQQNYQDEADAYRDMLEAQMESATSAQSKNTYLAKEVQYITQSYDAQIAIAKLEGNVAKQHELEAKKQKELLENKNQQLQNLSDEQSAQYDLNQQLENNANTAKDKNKCEAASRENLKSQYAYEIQIARNNGDITEEKRLQAELEEGIAESYKQEIENLKEEYNLIIGIQDARKSTIDSKISALQANGYSVAVELYKEQQGIALDNYQTTLSEIRDITDEMRNLDPASQDYKNYEIDLESYKQEAWGYQQAWAESQQAINDINLSKIEHIGTLLGYQANQLEHIQNILGHSNFTLSEKDIGGLTIEGLSRAAISFQQMQNNNKQIVNKLEQIDEINRQIDSKEYVGTQEQAEEDIYNLTKEIEELEESNYDLGESIKDMVIDSLNSLSDALDESISKYKDALQVQKDLYDYRRKVADQLKSIASLEKQLAALQGSDTEEARARIQNLKIHLEEEQQNLKDTEYEKYIQDQEEMLDRVSDDFQDFIANVTDMSVSEICAAVGNAVTDHKDEISQAIINAFEESTAIGSVADSITSLEETMSNINFSTKITLNTDSSGKITGISINGEEVNVSKNDGMDDVTNDIDNASATSNYEKGNSGTTGSSSSTVATTTASTTTPARTTTTASTTTPARTEIQKKIDDYIPGKLKTKSQLGYSDSVVTKRKKNDPATKYLLDKYSNKSLSYINEANLANSLAGKFERIPADFNPNKTDAKKLKSYGNALLTKLKNAGFSKGGMVSQLNKVAIANGDDGWATLKRGESVLTPSQTEQFQKLIENLVPLNIVAETIASLPSNPTPVNHSSSTTTTVRNVDIHLDGSHVIDADSFIQTLHNPKVLREVSSGVSSQLGNAMSNQLGTF